MNPTRRRFLQQTALGSVGPLIVNWATLGRGQGVAASERVGLATIGVGNRGLTNQRGFKQDERVQLVAVCDVDSRRLERARTDGGLPESAAFSDAREVLARPDVDAVMIGTPDHWHALLAVAAVRAGKDVYCEKPLTGSIGEGRFLTDAVREANAVLQCGTQRRSSDHTRRACELVRNGSIGTVEKVEVGVRGTFNVEFGFTGMEEPEPVPSHLDYEMWQGPAQAAPYTPARVHFNFRWVNAYAPGYITDWGVHFVDVVQWALGMDESGPVEVVVREQTRRSQGLYDAPENFHIDYRYGNGVKMTMKSETDPKKWGIRFHGSEGWIHTEGKRLEASPSSLLDQEVKEGDARLYVSSNHYRNFIDCVYSREPTAVTAETGHRSATACYLGAIAAEVRAPLKFDPGTERFVDHEAANQYLMKPMRSPWTFEKYGV